MTQIMIGKLFTYIPVGNIAYRVNLMSAFFGALAVTQVYAIVRLLGGITIAGIRAAMMLGFSSVFWRNALVAESYAPAAGMITTIWLFVLCWRRTQQSCYLFHAGLAGGLSLGIHSTVVMTAIPVLATCFSTARQRREWVVQQYCAEAQAQGYTARPEMVGKLLLLPSHQWGAQFSDTEIAIASRIQYESKS